MSSFRIGDRVQLLGTPYSGSVFANSYLHRGRSRTAVVWDMDPCLTPRVCDSKELMLFYGSNVPPEARPVSVGAMAGGGR